MKQLELKIPPLALVAVFAVGMWLQASLTPALSFSGAWQVLLATLLAIVGATIACAGVLAFRRAQTTVNPTSPESSSSVVSDGIYGYSRNPMYVGFFLWLLAVAALLGNVLALLWLPLFVSYINRYQIVPEERALHAHFGAEYSAYLARVRRWI
jgi:protein-S-isoprenylcysteine O-methyltransferase Ste14